MTTRLPTSAPRICVVVPVYNHGVTVERVVCEANASFPVIAVNDGSTDGTAGALASHSEMIVITLRRRQGKGAALKAGLAQAQQMGFSHAITLDADGQHSTAALPGFAAACQRHPQAFIVGVRQLRAQGAPWGRRFANALSNLCFRFETGVDLPDTQCGYRGYPLAAVGQLSVRSGGYAWELEILAKAAWAGFVLLPQPVQADYAAVTSRMSHFHPCRDLAHLGWLHLLLAAQSLWKRATATTAKHENH